MNKIFVLAAIFAVLGGVYSDECAGTSKDFCVAEESLKAGKYFLLIIFLEGILCHFISSSIIVNIFEKLVKLSKSLI